MYENFIAERIEQLLKTKGVSAYKASYDLGQSKTYIGKITKAKNNAVYENVFGNL